MVNEEHEVTDDEAPPPVAAKPGVATPAAAGAMKPKAKQASIMGFFAKKPST